MNGYDDGKIIEQLQAEVARLTDEVDRLTAENAAAWDTIETLGNFLTSEEISEELKRHGLDVTRAFERVKAALRAKKGGDHE